MVRSRPRRAMGTPRAAWRKQGAAGDRCPASPAGADRVRHQHCSGTRGPRRVRHGVSVGCPEVGPRGESERRSVESDATQQPDGARRDLRLRARHAGLKKVTFYLDDSRQSRSPVRTEFVPPFDFAGTASDGSANPFDTATLVDGPHTITAVLKWSYGEAPCVVPPSRSTTMVGTTPPTSTTSRHLPPRSRRRRPARHPTTTTLRRPRTPTATPTRHAATPTRTPTVTPTRHSYADPHTDGDTHGRPPPATPTDHDADAAHRR